MRRASCGGRNTPGSNWIAAATVLMVSLAATGAIDAAGAEGGERVAPRLEIAGPSDSVGLYRRIEFAIDLPPVEGNPFDPSDVDLTLRISAPSGKVISVPAFFTQPYARRTVDRGGRSVDWCHPVGPPVWRARFASADAGRHEAVAQLVAGGETTVSNAVVFEVLPSGGRGFVRVSRKDPRFLELSTGEAFFPIGQNLAFIGDGQHVNLARAEKILAALSERGANYLRVWTCCEDWAMALEARKSAWGRSWDWRPPIVPAPADPSDAGGSTSRLCLEIPADAPLRAMPSHPVALKPSAPYVLSGKLRVHGDAAVRLVLDGRSRTLPAAPQDAWVDFREAHETGSSQLWLGELSFRRDGSGKAWLSDLALRELSGDGSAGHLGERPLVPSGANLLWEADVNRPARGSYNLLDAFLLDELVAAAEKHGIYLQLCLLTRDLYMGALKDPAAPEYRQATRDATNLLRYAVARWGCSTSVAAWEYFNEMDPGLPSGPFYTELGQYLEVADPYGHLRTTSAWGPAPADWKHEEMDLADMHFYLRPSDLPRLRDEVEAILERTRFLLDGAPGRPARLAEFGLADEKWRLTPEMERSPELVDFHNGLWASALSGASGTALFWWWERLDRRDAYATYGPLSMFLADVPWTTAGLRPVDASVAGAELRIAGLQGGDRAYLWVFDPRSSWSASALDGVTAPEVQGATVTVRGLGPGAARAAWWDTREAKVIREDVLSPSGDTVTLHVPTFRRDVACKVTP